MPTPPPSTAIVAPNSIMNPSIVWIKEKWFKKYPDHKHARRQNWHPSLNKLVPVKLVGFDKKLSPQQLCLLMSSDPSYLTIVSKSNVVDNKY